MEEKSLRNNRPKAWDSIGITQKVVKDCPFCGSKVITRVAKRMNTRWFSCPMCSMSLKFENLAPEEALEAFNTRAGDEE